MSRKGKFSRKIYGRENRRGATAIIVAIVLVVLLGVAALAVDIGYLYAAKNELQNAADSAALAGARQLGNIYSQLTVSQQMAYTAEAGDQTLIRNTAIDVASQNKAATQSILINAAEVEIGQWASGAFTATTNQPDAVRVTARRDAGTGGTIGTFFARVLGINEASVVADATAALSPQSTTEPGELELPVGISEFRFTSDYCDKPIKFNPTGTLDGCAGWHTFDESPSNASTLGNTIIQGMIDDPPTYTSPGTVVGTTDVDFIGGNLASALPDLAALLAARAPTELGPMYFKDGNIGYTDAAGEWHFWDGTEGAELITDNQGNAIPRREWETGVVVYEATDCSNPTGLLSIVGYATVKLWTVLEAGTKPNDAAQLIVGQIVCGGFFDGRGGGGMALGPMGTIPGLVE